MRYRYYTSHFSVKKIFDHFHKKIFETLRISLRDILAKFLELI